MAELTGRLSTALADRYIVERRLGEGGMATVYLAEDLKHKRKVALKVLRPELAAVLGGDRFVQEITTTASLQHPHILPLFDSGTADGFLFYVMPYVEGETLREKLNRETQLGIDEAVKIAMDVADALDYAHRRGVIHRDIKPENILLHDGRPVVADFGIALAVSAAAGGRMTETGLSLGTPHYMSPEQATAEKEITGRSDVYSLSCVLYEMLTGEPPHTGASAQAIVMKIVTDDARPVTDLRKTVPPNVAATVAKGLAKLPADRFETAKAFAQALGNTEFKLPTLSGAVGPSGRVRTGSWNPLMVGLAAVAVIMTVAAVLALMRPVPEAPVTRQRTVLWEEQPTGLWPLRLRTAISPDGSAIVYSGNVGERPQLLLKRRNEVVPAPLAGTDGGSGPFFSPDGAWIGFVTGGTLRKVPSGGGAALTLADSASTTTPGAAWLDDGTIIYVGTPFDLRRVSAAGGSWEVVVSNTDIGGRFATLPWPLPRSRGVLFTACNANCSTSDVHVYDTRADTARLLFPEALGAWYAEGYVLYASLTSGLFAAPFDLKRLEVTGPAVPVIDGLQAPELTFSPEGTALYVLGQTANLGIQELVWVDRTGRATPVQSGWTFRPGGANWGMALSPDGSRIALKIETDLGPDIWIKPLPDGPLSRFTFHEGEERMPRWSPDGRFVTFLSDRGGDLDLYRAPADGTGEPELLLDHDVFLAQGFYSPDGEWLVVRTGGVGGVRGGRNILGFRPGVDSVPVPLVATANDEQAPAVSPDSRWLAYLSDETGRNEVFIRPFPDTQRGKWQVSEGGATAPVWAHNGRELFYVSANGDMTAARIDPGPPFSVRERRVLFRVAPEYVWSVVQGSIDISPDDQRFLMRRNAGIEEEGDTRQFVSVQNWFRELREKGRRP